MIVDYQFVKIVDMIIDKVIFNRIHHILMFFITFCVFVIIEKLELGVIGWWNILKNLKMSLKIM